MSDLIDRQAAISVVRKCSVKEVTPTYMLIDKAEVMTELMMLPSAQPEPCKDAVSREAVSEWLKQYGQDVLHGKYKFSLMYIWKNLMDLPSVQPEIIRCKDCKYVDNDGVCQNSMGLAIQDDDDFCSYAERGADADTEV